MSSCKLTGVATGSMGATVGVEFEDRSTFFFFGNAGRLSGSINGDSKFFLANPPGKFFGYLKTSFAFFSSLIMKSSNTHHKHLCLISQLCEKLSREKQQGTKISISAIVIDPHVGPQLSI